MKTTQTTKRTNHRLQIAKILIVFVLVGCVFFSMQGCGLQISATKEELQAGDSLFLRGFRGDSQNFEWSVQSSDTLLSLQITFGENKCNDISCCNKKELCSVQRGRNSPSGALLITLKDASKGEAKFVIPLPPNPEPSSEENTQTSTEKTQEPTQTDGGIKE